MLLFGKSRYAMFFLIFARVVFNALSLISIFFKSSINYMGQLTLFQISATSFRDLLS